MFQTWNCCTLGAIGKLLGENQGFGIGAHPPELFKWFVITISGRFYIKEQKI
jgi:hypothetical protein